MDLFCLIKEIKADQVSAAVAVIALGLTIFEYYFRRRPYLKLDIEVIERDGGFVFYAHTINFGTVPAHFTLKKEDVTIKIGDEKFFSAKDMDAYVFPNDTQSPSFEIGSINEIGVRKLINHEYKDNTAYLEVILRYSSYRLKWWSYKFRFRYSVTLNDCKNGGPRVTVGVIDQSFT